MTNAGRLALIGSGEHDPAMQDVLDWLIEGRPRRLVQVATAAGFDGARALGRWHDAGAESAERLGAQQVVVDVRTRDEADTSDLAAAVAGAGVITISGQTSGYLVQTLRGTRVWAAVLAAWRDGAALAAGGVAAMALGGSVPDARGGVSRGLGVVPALRLVPDIDSLGPSIPHTVLAPLADPRATVVGLDRTTALVGEGPAEDGRWEFRARGRGSAWLIEPAGRRRVLAPLRLDVADGPDA